MYLKSYKDQMKLVEGKLSMIMPFPLSDSAISSANWPVIDPRGDSGKYIIGLFEGGKDTNGVSVNAVSTWTSPRDLLATIGREAGQDVGFMAVSPSELRGSLPENISYEITETMLLVGEYEYYGKDEAKNQQRSDSWLAEGTTTMSLGQVVKMNGPWNFA